MALLLFILLTKAGILEAVFSAGFVKIEIPPGNFAINDQQESVSTPVLCSMRCLQNNGTGKECRVFSFNETNQVCEMGVFSDLDMSDVENITKIAWKEKGYGCEYPPDPQYGRFSCIKNTKHEKCFLVCDPGYVPQLYRGLYCNISVYEWNKPVNGFKCLPSIIALIGGYAGPKVKQISVFGPEGQVILNNNSGSTLREHTTQYFSGIALTCGGYWYTSAECYVYNFTTGNGMRKLQLGLNISRFGHTSAVVRDRYYLIGGKSVKAWSKTEYLQEGDESVTYEGILTPEINSSAGPGCAVRFSDRSFLYMGEYNVTEYDIISGVSKALPGFNFPRKNFGCDAFLDEDGERSIIVVGGDYSNKTAEIFKPSVGQWTRIGDLTYPRIMHAVVTTSEGVFAIGGGNFPGQVEKLDLMTKTWVDTGLIFEKTYAYRFSGTAIPAHFLPP